MIGATVPDSVFLQLQSKLNAKEVWDTLKALYETCSELTKIDLALHLQSTKCGEDDDVRIHYQRLAAMREQLAAMGKMIPDQEYAGILMGSLPSSYESVLHLISSSAYIHQSAITTEIVLKLVIDAFERRQRDNNSKAQDEAFAAQNQKKRAGKKREVECFNCHKKGHMKADCWAKGGGKEGQGPKKRDGRGSQSSAAATAKEAASFFLMKKNGAA